MSDSPPENPPKRVLLFATCLVDQFFPEVGEATVHLLESAGVEPVYPEGITCCGLPHYNNGFKTEARKILESQLHLLEGNIPIVVPSGSCGWMLQCVLPTLFPDDPWARERAAQIAGRVVELSQFLCRIQARDFGAALPGKTVYHDSCHLLRGLGESRAPRQCLDRVAERREELPGCERCCGFGGSFSIKFPKVSCAMLEDKIQSAEKVDATWLVAADAGCMLQIAGGLSRRKSNVQLLHLAQALVGPSGPGWPEERRI